MPTSALAHGHLTFVADDVFHWITWSARSSKDGAIVSPSAFAVLSGLEVYHQLELGGLLDGQLRGFGAGEDPVDVGRGTPTKVGEINAVGHEAPRVHERPVRVDCRELVRRREGNNLVATIIDQGISYDQEEHDEDDRFRRAAGGAQQAEGVGQPRVVRLPDACGRHDLQGGPCQYLKVSMLVPCEANVYTSPRPAERVAGGIGLVENPLFARGARVLSSSLTPIRKLSISAADPK